MNAQSVGRFMTEAPHSVGRGQTLSFAKDLMHEFGVRHLPVLEGGKLVGMLTERDLALVSALKDVDVAKVTVWEAMSQDVFTAEPSTPLAEIATKMAESKVGSVVVMEGMRIVGIFTTVDLAKAVTQLLAPT